MTPASARQRAILERVAAGEITPDEAAVLLAAAEIADKSEGLADDATQPEDVRPAPSRPVGSAPQPSEHVATVRLRTNCRAVSVVGDPNVRTAVAEGEHTARVEGEVLVIESMLDRTSGFAFMRNPGSGHARAMVRIGSEHVRPLLVRMNPDLALDSQVDAGSVTIRGVHGPIRAHTSAGALRIDDFDGPIEMKVAAGSATARGRMTHGSSRIECDAGKVSVRLSADSSVKVKGRVSLGQLSAPDMVGAGAGTLDIVANLGSVEVAVDDADGEQGGPGE